MILVIACCIAYVRSVPVADPRPEPAPVAEPKPDSSLVGAVKEPVKANAEDMKKGADDLSPSSTFGFGFYPYAYGYPFAYGFYPYHHLAVSKHLVLL